MGGADRQKNRQPGMQTPRSPMGMGGMTASGPRPEDMAPAEAPAPTGQGMTQSRLGTGQSAPRPMPAAPAQNVWNSANSNMAASAVAL
jgi:hypothetical protein